MGTDDKKLSWDKDAKLSFTLKDCTISSSALDSLKEGEIYYESVTGETCIGTATGYKPIKISYDAASASYPIGTIKTITKEQEQIETLIKAVTNLIKEVEELKKNNMIMIGRTECLEAENEGLRTDVNDLFKISSTLEERCKSQEKRIDYLIEEKDRLNAEIQLLKEPKEDKKIEYDFKF